MNQCIRPTLPFSLLLSLLAIHACSGGGADGSDASVDGATDASTDTMLDTNVDSSSVDARTDSSEGDAAIGTLVSASDGGTVSSADGILRLEIPPAALAEDTVISIVPVAAADVETGPGSLNVYELSPDGLELAQPAIAIYMLPEGTIEPEASPFRAPAVVSYSDAVGLELLSVGAFGNDSLGNVEIVGPVEHFSQLSWKFGIDYEWSSTCATCIVGEAAAVDIEYTANSEYLAFGVELASGEVTRVLGPIVASDLTIWVGPELSITDDSARLDFMCVEEGSAEMELELSFWRGRFNRDRLAPHIRDGFVVPIECVSRPAHGSATSCGDGAVNGTDQCDGAAFPILYESCDALPDATASGMPSCTPECRFDFNVCYPGIPNENRFCANLGAYVDQLFDNLLCDYCAPLGAHPEPVDVDCASLCGADGTCAGYLTGGEDTCVLAGLPPDPDCTALCGDGVRNGNEQCDGVDFGPWTCAAADFSGGTLGCTADCALDFSECLPGGCGNGVRDVGEYCDGDELHGKDCTSLGYTAGTLGCTGECTYDESACVAPGEQGDCCFATPGVSGCSVDTTRICVCGWDSSCCSGEYGLYCAWLATYACGSDCR